MINGFSSFVQGKYNVMYEIEDEDAGNYLQPHHSHFLLLDDGRENLPMPGYYSLRSDIEEAIAASRLQSQMLLASRNKITSLNKLNIEYHF